MTPAQIREKIASLRMQHANAAGRIASLEAEVESARKDLCEVLDCEEGREREAIQALLSSVKEAEARAKDLLDRVDEAL